MKESSNSWRSLRWGMLILLIALAGAIVLPWRLGSGKQRPIVIQVSTNGFPVLWGVPLRNQSVRDFVFKALHASGAPVEVALPASFNPTPSMITNMTQTVKAAFREKLIRPNPPKTNQINRYE